MQGEVKCLICETETHVEAYGLLLPPDFKCPRCGGRYFVVPASSAFANAPKPGTRERAPSDG
jgi:DNA-directed RNA polymerase subunit RPC12/RpoP